MCLSKYIYVVSIHANGIFLLLNTVLESSRRRDFYLILYFDCIDMFLVRLQQRFCYNISSIVVAESDSVCVRESVCVVYLVYILYCI